MNDYRLNIGAGDIQKIKMSPEEKKSTLEHVLSSLPSPEHVPSPDQFYPLFKKIRKNRFVYYGLMSCLVIVICVEIILASNDSSFGSFLYPLKANIIEQVRSVLHFSPGDKAPSESKLPTKPLIETETLINQNNLDEPKKDTLKILPDAQTKSLAGSINESRPKLSNNEENDDQTPSRQTKINDTSRTSEKSRKFHQADNAKDTKEYTKNSFRKLLDPEGWVKRGDDFLKTGPKLKGGEVKH